MSKQNRLVWRDGNIYLVTEEIPSIKQQQNQRLEEIKEDVFKCNHGSTRGYSYEQLYSIALNLVRIHGEWLIEQAEQNKRYHEIIKNLKMMVEDIDIDCGMICHEIRLIDLEGEEK